MKNVLVIDKARLRISRLAVGNSNGTGAIIGRIRSKYKSILETSSYHEA